MMIKKKVLIYLGLFISFIGVAILFNSLRINGFVVSETLSNFSSYLLPLILFFVGILISSSADSLQAYLEAREAENPSPSLEDKLQTAEEGKYFAEREQAANFRKKKGIPLSYNFVQKMFRKNKGLNLEPEESFKLNYEGNLLKKGENQKIKDDWWRNSEKTISNWETATGYAEKDENGKWVNKPKYTTREHKLNEETKIIESLKKKLKQTETEIPSAENPEKLYGLYPEHVLNVDSLKDIFAKGSFGYKKETLDRRRAYDLKKAQEDSKKLLIEYNEKLIKDTIENKEAFSDENPEENEHCAGVTSSKIARQHSFFEKLIGLLRTQPIEKYYSRPERKDLVTMDQLREMYINQAKTVPLSRHTNKHFFIHAFKNPFSRDTYLSPGEDTTRPSLGRINPSYEDQLNVLKTVSPLLSISSANKEKVQTNLFDERAAGVLFEEGDIYDASRHDLHSRGIHGKRIKTRRKNPHFNSRENDGEASLEIERRVEEALKGPDIPHQRHNEFIVGNYKIGGFILNPDLFYKIGQNAKDVYENPTTVRREGIKRILDESERLNVPVFKYDSKSDSKFIQIDPRDYSKEFFYRV